MAMSILLNLIVVTGLFSISIGCSDKALSPMDSALQDMDTADTSGNSAPDPIETVGIHAQVEGPFLFDERQYFVGINYETYDEANPIGVVYLLHGLGASGCDFIDRYSPAQFVKEAMERGYAVVLPESAAQSGSCRYEVQNGTFRKDAL